VINSATVPVIPCTPGILSVSASGGFATGPGISFANGGGITFGVAGNTITASVMTASDAGVGISAAGASAGTGVVTFSNSNNVSFGMAGSVVTATATFASTETPFGISAGTQSVSTGTLVFSNSNGVTFGMSGSSQITANFSSLVFSNSNNVSFGTNGSTVTATATFAAETPFGISAGTQSVSTGTLVFSNSNGVSFGMSGSSRITASFSTLVFSNSNNVSFGTNGSTVTATATFPAQVAFAISAGTQSVSTGTLVFSNSNGVTFGMSGSSRVTASFSTLVFSNSNNVSFGTNGSTVTATATFAQVAFAISAGTQSVSTGTLIFANSNGVTFGMSGSSQITASYSQSTAPAGIAVAGSTITNGTVLFSNANSVTFGMAGSTITASVAGGGPAISYWDNVPGPYWLSAAGQANPATPLGNMVVFRLLIPNQISATRVDYLGAFLNANHTGSVYYQLFTMSGSTASLVSSATGTVSFPAAVQDPFANGRSLALGTWNVTPGEYLMAIGISDGGGQAPYLMGQANFYNSNNASQPYFQLAGHTGVSVAASIVLSNATALKSCVPWIRLLGTY